MKVIWQANQACQTDRRQASTSKNQEEKDKEEAQSDKATKHGNMDELATIQRQCGGMWREADECSGNS